MMILIAVLLGLILLTMWVGVEGIKHGIAYILGTALGLAGAFLFWWGVIALVDFASGLMGIEPGTLVSLLLFGTIGSYGLYNAVVWVKGLCRREEIAEG